MSHPKHATSEHEILDVIGRRWSPRAFDPDRAVPVADLRTLFEAARWAPSSFNEQPWRFLVTDRRRTPEAFERLASTLDPANFDWARHAPVLVLVSISTRMTKIDGANRHAAYDAGQAVAFLSLQATSLGIALRQMEGFNNDRAREVCAVPAEFEPLVVMAVGYPGDPERLTVEKHRTAERQPRQRHGHDVFVYDGVWGRALTRRA